MSWISAPRVSEESAYLVNVFSEDQKVQTFPLARRLPYLALTPRMLNGCWYSTTSSWPSDDKIGRTGKVIVDGIVTWLGSLLKVADDNISYSLRFQHPGEYRATTFMQAAYKELAGLEGGHVVKKTDRERWDHLTLQGALLDRVYWMHFAMENEDSMDMLSGEYQVAHYTQEQLINMRTSGVEKLLECRSESPKHLFEFLRGVATLTEKDDETDVTNPSLSLLKGHLRGKASVAVGYGIHNLAAAALALRAMALVSL